MTTGERTLYVESGHLGHAHVEYRTAQLVVLDRVQKIRAGRECLDRETGGGNQERSGR